jgi:DNA-binding XRE family transcriptional regulator
MKFDHSKLLGKIRECGYTQKTLAKAIGMSVSTLNKKLNNGAYFSTLEISKIRMVLGIYAEEIGEFFYCLKSS